MDHITATSIRRLMRKHGKTIRGLAREMGISLKRVREVREKGVEGVAYVLDWMEAITGNAHGGWTVVMKSYL